MISSVIQPFVDMEIFGPIISEGHCLTPPQFHFLAFTAVTKDISDDLFGIFVLVGFNERVTLGPLDIADNHGSIHIGLGVTIAVVGEVVVSADLVGAHSDGHLPLEEV